MKIGLNATCLNSRPSGAKQRFIGIYKALFNRMPNDEFVVYQTPGSELNSLFVQHRNVEFVTAPIPDAGRLKKFLASIKYWRKELVSRQFDIFEGYHLPFTSSPVGKNILTMHDIRGVSRTSGFFERIQFGTVLSDAFRKADHVITVSNAMRDDILEFSPDMEVSVIYNGIDADKFASADAEDLDNVLTKLGLSSNFILTVGHFEKRKNYTRLIEALAGLHKVGKTVNLVMVGNDSGEMQTIRRLTDSLGLSAHVVILSGVSDDTVRCLYQLARLFVFPSYYEGFGIPVLEAMASGCPMVLSDIPVFREITRGQGLYFPYDNVNAMIEVIVTGLESEPERQRQLVSNANRIMDFAFDGLAIELEALYYRLNSDQY